MSHTQSQHCGYSRFTVRVNSTADYLHLHKYNQMQSRFLLCVYSVCDEVDDKYEYCTERRQILQKSIQKPHARHHVKIVGQR